MAINRTANGGAHLEVYCVETIRAVSNGITTERWGLFSRLVLHRINTAFDLAGELQVSLRFLESEARAALLVQPPVLRLHDPGAVLELIVDAVTTVYSMVRGVRTGTQSLGNLLWMTRVAAASPGSGFDHVREMHRTDLEAMGGDTDAFPGRVTSAMRMQGMVPMLALSVANAKATKQAMDNPNVAVAPVQSQAGIAAWNQNVVTPTSVVSLGPSASHAGVTTPSSVVSNQRGGCWRCGTPGHRHPECVAPYTIQGFDPKQPSRAYRPFKGL